MCYKTEALISSGILSLSLAISTCSGVELLPRVKQHLSAEPFVVQVVRRFSLVKPDDPVNEARLRAYLAEDLLPSGQQIEYEGKDGSNRAATKIERYVLSV